MLGVGVLLAAVFAGRLINERGMRVLNPEQKARFVDAFATERKYSMVPLLAVVVVFIAYPGRLPMWALLLALLGYVIAMSIFSVRKMRSIALPDSYVRAYTAARALQVGGLIVYFGIVRGWTF
jgi:hypothetical protein